MNKIYLLSGLLIILILVIGALYVTFIKDKSNKIEFNFNGVTLSVNDYNAIQEKFKDSPIVRVCNIEKGDCIILGKT